LTKFAFIVHPIHARDGARSYPWMKVLPDRLIEVMMKKLKPKALGHITGVESAAGAKTEGWFIGLPMTPRMMLSQPELAVDLIVECGKIAADLGAEVIGLGAYSAIVGRGGLDAQPRLPLAVTTGNSYTVATAIEGSLKAAAMIGLNPQESVLGVVGATGSIGRTCALALSPLFARTLLVGRDLERTKEETRSCPRAEASIDPMVLKAADVVVTVTSAESAVIEPRHLSPGTIVCDVSRPRDVSVRVAKERPDVLVIEGGIVKVPGRPDFGLDFGFPPETAYACMCETMLLALEGRPENYTLGKEVSLSQVEETQQWAARHGFTLAGFRSFEKEVGEEAFARVRDARRDRPRLQESLR
jgi:fatty aldehyde-generating acyl-ACP reductase